MRRVSAILAVSGFAALAMMLGTIKHDEASLMRLRQESRSLAPTAQKLTGLFVDTLFHQDGSRISFEDAMVQWAGVTRPPVYLSEASWKRGEGLRWRGFAPDLASALAYVDRVNRSAVFAQARLVSCRAQVNRPDAGVIFEMVMP